MRSLVMTLFLLFLVHGVFAQVDPSFYLPDDTAVDQDVPFPGEYSGHRFGWWHFSHDQLVDYLDELAEQSPKVTIGEYGRTHENRPLELLTITSADNHRRLEQIRQAHLDYIHGRSTAYVDQEMPLIIWLGYSVHGNESSPGNASMLTAWYLAASQSQEVEKMLDEAVILIDPVLNPDGFSRAAHWSNMHMHQAQTLDRRHRQFREDWPGGRTNHYWFDLNRDWMPAQHPESQTRLKLYHSWKPHVVTDHHEMGSNSTFFFQPGEPERTNPRTPVGNFDLTRRLAHYHARALDDIGSLYFSEEGFDDFYYGKGSTYPDGNGSIGILFEQSRVLGQILENDHGERTFAQAIRNQFTVSLSTLRGAMEMRRELIDYQRSFFKDIPQLVDQDPVKGYVFSSPHDPWRLYHFLKLLDRHQIQVHRVKSDYQTQDQYFSQSDSYLVDCDQRQYRFVKSLFEKRVHFTDSIFYDISTWTMPLAFNLDHAPLKSEQEVSRLAGSLVKGVEPLSGKVVGGESRVGYMISGTYYNIYSIIHELQEEDITVKALTKSTSVASSSDTHDFEPGSLFIPARRQPLTPEQIHGFLQEMAGEQGVDFYGVQSALTGKGVDLGSWSVVPLEKRRILLIAGEGTRSYSAGEIWHLLDNRYRIPVVLVKPDQLKRINLFDFNTLIMPDGSYNSWGEATKKKLKAWLEADNVLVAMEDANEWLHRKNMIDMERKDLSESDTVRSLPYNERRNRSQAQQISGVILRASVDPTHPINYGIHGKTMPVFKDNDEIYQNKGNPYDVPVMIGEAPLLSGYLSDENLARIEKTPYCKVHHPGGGTIISFTANPNFRAFWYGTNPLFMNALFYGSLLR